MSEDEKRVPLKPVIAIVISLIVIGMMYKAGEITKDTYEKYVKDLKKRD